MSAPKKKIMVSLHPDIYDFLQARANDRKLTFQEYLRDLLGQYFIDNGGGRRKLGP
jgi:hypothetical protein